MDYNQPLGAAANAAYINGDPSVGQKGSIPPAPAFEYPQREIVAVINYAHAHGLIDYNGTECAVPANGDLAQLVKAIYGIAGGSVGGGGALFNTTHFSSSTRVSMIGVAGNSHTVTCWSGISYVKVSATSNLIIWYSAPTFTSAMFGAGAGDCVLAVGGTSIPLIATNNISLEARGQTNAVEKLTGISAGSKAITVTFRRLDGQDWNTIFCPTTSDVSWLPGTSYASLLIAEYEP